MSKSVFLLCLVPFVVGNYQYVYQYDDGALKMLMNKPAAALCNCEADLVITYDDDDALDAAAAATAIQQALGAVGVNAGVLPAASTHSAHTAHTPTVHTTAHTTTHTVHTPSSNSTITVHTPSSNTTHSVHTPHSATSVHTVHSAASPHTGTVHSAHSAHTVAAPSTASAHAASTHHGATATVHTPTVATVHTPTVATVHTPTVTTVHTAHTPTPTAHSGMGMNNKVAKRVRVISFDVAVDTPCGEEPTFDDEAAVVAALEASLGVDVLTASYSNAVCTSCTDILTNIAEVCPGTATVALCQDVASAILCSPEETDTEVSVPAKQTCSYDFSSLDDLENYYETQCDDIGGAI